MFLTIVYLSCINPNAADRLEAMSTEALSLSHGERVGVRGYGLS